jgi:hypothetical protein
MANFKMATPPHIKKALKKAKSEYKSLVTTQQDRFKSIQGNCARSILNASQFNAGSLRVQLL